MKIRTFSIVVGDQRCNANCRFCIAKMTASPVSDTIEFHPGKFKTCLRIVDMASDGLLTVNLTGQGEPLLFTEQITQYIEAINFRFPLIELQTNGVLVKKNLNKFRHWRDEGLTLVSLSIADNWHKASNEIMGIKDTNYDYWKTASMLMDIGLNVRLSCTMTKAGAYLPETCETIIIRANNAGILQTTFREVEMPGQCENTKIGDWVREHKPHGAAKALHHYLAMKGAIKLLELPHGGVVYSYLGQNAAIGTCLTETTDSDDIRQLIWFPDGRVAYSWQYPAARII